MFSFISLFPISQTLLSFFLESCYYYQRKFAYLSASIRVYMSTTRKLAHNTIIQLIGKVVSTALGLVAIKMMTTYLGVEQFGWYVTAISFLQFIGILTDFGVIPVTAQMLSEQPNQKKRLFQNILTFRVITGFIFFGIAPLLVLFFPYPVTVKLAVAVMSISFMAISINQVLTGLYQDRLQMHYQAIGEVIGRIVLVGGLWLLIQEKASFLTVMALVSLSSVSYTTYMCLKARQFVSFRPRFDKDIWKRMIKKMWPIAISIMFNVVYLKGDVLLLSLFREQEIVGIYGAAYRVIDILAQTAMLFMGVMLPLLTHAWVTKNKEVFHKYYQQAFDVMMMLVLPMTVGVIALAEPIILLIADSSYLPAASILRILAIAVLGVYLGATFSHIAVAIDKQKQTMWIYISSAILTLVGYLIFIPLYGMYGAAWMSVFSELYVGILLFFIIKKFAKQQLSLKTSRKIFIAALVMGSVVWYLPNLHIIFRVFLGAGVYALFLYMFGAISKETLREVFAIKKKQLQ